MDVEPEKRLGQRGVVSEGGQRVVGVARAVRGQHGRKRPLDSLIPLISRQRRQAHREGPLGQRESYSHFQLTDLHDSLGLVNANRSLGPAPA